MSFVDSDNTCYINMGHGSVDHVNAKHCCSYWTLQFHSTGNVKKIATLFAADVDAY